MRTKNNSTLRFWFQQGTSEDRNRYILEEAAGRREKEPAVKAPVAAAVIRPQEGRGIKRQIDSEERQIDSEERPVEGKGTNSGEGPKDQGAGEIGTKQIEPEDRNMEGGSSSKQQHAAACTVGTNNADGPEDQNAKEFGTNEGRQVGTKRKRGTKGYTSIAQGNKSIKRETERGQTQLNFGIKKGGEAGGERRDGTGFRKEIWRQGGSRSP